MKAIIFVSALLLGNLVFAADETIAIDTVLHVQVCAKEAQKCMPYFKEGDGKITLHESERGTSMGITTIETTVANVNFKFSLLIVKDRQDQYTVSAIYATGDITKENQGKIIGRYFVSDLSQIVEHAWFGDEIETDKLVLIPYFTNSRVKK